MGVACPSWPAEIHILKEVAVKALTYSKIHVNVAKQCIVNTLVCHYLLIREFEITAMEVFRKLIVQPVLRLKTKLYENLLTFCHLGGHITHASVNNVSGYANHVMKYLFTLTGYTSLVHLLFCPEPKYIDYIPSNTLIMHG